MLSRPARLAVLVVIVGLAAGGCTSHDPVTAPASSAPSTAGDSRTPLQVLMAGVPTESSPIYRYSIGSDRPMSGVIDPPDQIAEFVTVRQATKPVHTETTTVLLTRDRFWLKVKVTPAALQAVPKKWMSLDPKKIPQNGKPYVYGAESDPGYTKEVFENASDLSQTSPGHFRGVTNLGETGAGVILGADQLKALGGKAGHVAFTAVLDGQGRLTTTSLQIPAAGKFKASTYLITYDQYGTAAVPKLPTQTEQTKAPSYVYDWYR
ncbi:hypothetical protein [Paractinoplanes globisporus]|uniref:Lipoprotein n=1 Tax=Paractinoplanes globisporus TaxID=113565 RepID=A0ABW6WBB0_9ACTN|nr:hypothetical protein [Actinoplanes globisporus]